MTVMEKRKTLNWVGRAKEELIEIGDQKIIQRIGFQLKLVQHGLMPGDFKPMTSIGHGVYEIRVEDNEGSNIGRCFYVAKFEYNIYVLHNFVKKSQKTPQKNIDIGRKRYSDLLRCLGKAGG